MSLSKTVPHKAEHFELEETKSEKDIPTMTCLHRKHFFGIFTDKKKIKLSILKRSLAILPKPKHLSLKAKHMMYKFILKSEFFIKLLSLPFPV